MSLLTLVVLILIGLAGGWLVNYLSDELPWKRRLESPFCTSCQASINWTDYSMWWRACPKCSKHRSWRYGFISLVYILLAVLLWRYPPSILGSWLGLVLLLYFGVVVVIDVEHRLILHPVSLFGAGLGIVTGTWLRTHYYAAHGATQGFQFLGVKSQAWLQGLGACLLGGVVGFFIMWVLYTLGDRLIRGIARRRGQPAEEVALGFGDVNLSGVLGLMLGWPVIILGLFVAIFVGGIVSLIYLMVLLLNRRYHLFTALPYGPYLVAGAILLLYFPQLVTSYLR